MAMIKALSVTFNSAGSMYVVDTLGRVWVKTIGNGQWIQETLPQEPES